MNLKKYNLLFAILLLFFSCKTQEEATVNGIKITPEEKAIRDSMVRISASSYIVEGMTYKLTGNYAEAINAFNKCLALEPDNDAALFNLSGLYASAGQAQNAIMFAEKAVNVDPKNEWYLLQLARIYQAAGNKAQAVEAFSKLNKLIPEKRDYSFYYADALIQNGEESKAIEVLNILEKQKGFDEEIIIQKYRIYAYVKKYNEAIVEVKKLIEKDPYDVSNYGIVAELYEEMGDQTSALKYYEKILELDPSNGIVHLSLAQYYYNQNNEAKAFQELKSAFESNALDLEVKMKVLYEYYERGEIDEILNEAYQLLEIVVRVHPTDAKAHAIYGDFLAREEKYEEARTHYRTAVEMDQNVYLLWNQLIILDIQVDANDDLYKDAKKASDLFPSQPTLLYYYGLGAHQKGLHQEAVEALSLAKDLIIDNNALLVQCYQLLGDSYNKLKQHQESDKAFDQALKLEPDNSFILNNYAYYLSLRKQQLEKAAQMSKRSNEIKTDQASFEDTYAYILFLQNKISEAEIWIKKAISHGGNNSGTILEHYGDILFKAGMTDAALEQWNKAKKAGGASNIIDRKIAEKKYIEN